MAPPRFKEGPSYVFTLIHKFNKPDAETYSNRSDIIVIADEAHRTQYGKLSENMRRVLPRASFLAFTGTPLMESEEDQLTRKVFGDYVSTYDFLRAIEDGATVPLYYDNRGDKLGIATDDVNERIAAVVAQHELEQDAEEKLKRELSREYPIVTAPGRLDRIAADLVAHFSKRWLTGKAMLDKPMKEHTLRQAIARANRVHEGKNNGLLVDYNGMLKSLRKALAKYGQGGRDGGGDEGARDPSVDDALLADYEEAIQACVDHLFEVPVHGVEVIRGGGVAPRSELAMVSRRKVST